jgi:cell division control protein 24
MQLSQRLEKVPGYQEHVANPDSEDEDEDIDPVSSLWRCLRKGTPLLAIYNSIHPAEPLTIDESMPETRKPKAAAFKFVKACLEDLKIPGGECITLQDLFGDDTTGFVKVYSSLSMCQYPD